MRIVIVIKSLGMLFTLIGIAYLLRPDIIKTLMGFFKKGKLNESINYRSCRIHRLAFV
jgi:hypothetical protein